MRVLHLTWKRAKKLNPSFRESLEVFYKRIPKPQDFKHLDRLAHEDVDKLLRGIDEVEEADWCVVHSEGVMYSDQDRLHADMLEHIGSLPPNTLVTGQLIDKQNRYCGIHEQVFAVNMKKYRELGCPAFGNYETKHLELQSYHAADSIHDDYTPKMIKPAEASKTYETWTCGWNFVDVSLKNGMEIHNLPDKIRDQKTYLYPDDNTEALNKNIEAVFSIEPTDNLSQNQVMTYLLTKKLGLYGQNKANRPYAFKTRKSSVFVFNTEHLIPDPEWTDNNRFPFHRYLGPCAGLLEFGNTVAYGHCHDLSLVYYDINQDAIDFKKAFWERFDGDLFDIPKFAEEFQKDRPDIILNTGHSDKNLWELKRLLKEQHLAFSEVFQTLKQAPKKYMHINLLQDYSRLLKEVEGDQHTLFAFSDIFLGQNELTYGRHNLEHLFYSFLKEAAKYECLVVTGKNTSDTPISEFAWKLMGAFRG